MKTARLVIVTVGGLFAGLGTLGLVACSAESPASTDTSSGGVDSGSRLDSGSGSDTGVTPPTVPPSPGDAGADCGKSPTLHAPKADGGMFCPFSAAAGGKDIYCPLGDQCCETPAGTSLSTCVTKGSACPVPSSVVWECEDPSDCPGSQKCCASGTDGGSVTVGTDTCGPYLSHFLGTRCAASCTASELVVCETQPECASGVCTPVKPKGNDVGVCH